MAIYLFLLLSWLLKLLLHLPSASQCANESFVCHATVGPIPGGGVIALVGCFYLALATITLLGYRHRDPSVEVLSRERTLQKLVSPSQQPVGRRQKYAEAHIFGLNDVKGDVSATED